jgi:signal-transduction protein with cAMP-binding, CBS, and nucleotidyltransferase domain
MLTRKLLGIIDHVNIFSSFAKHLYLISTQISKEKNIPELQTVNSIISPMIKSLIIKVRMTLINKLNRNRRD